MYEHYSVAVTAKATMAAMHSEPILPTVLSHPPCPSAEIPKVEYKKGTEQARAVVTHGGFRQIARRGLASGRPARAGSTGR